MLKALNCRMRHTLESNWIENQFLSLLGLHGGVTYGELRIMPRTMASLVRYYEIR
jgi:hypothetical protein